MDSRTHSIRWWITKVLAGFLLIGLVVEHYLIGVLPTLDTSPVRIGQALVIGGGLITVYHYAYAWYQTNKLSEPDQLITKFGLYRYIRHPMYTGDLITYTGLTVLAPGVASVLVLSIGAYAIWRHSTVEDRYMANRFDDVHRKWRERTFQLIPGFL